MEYKSLVLVSGCTDDILVVAVVKSVLYCHLPQQRQILHLCFLDASLLFDVMRTTFNRLQVQASLISSGSNDFGVINEGNIGVRLLLGMRGFIAWILCHADMSTMTAQERTSVLSERLIASSAALLFKYLSTPPLVMPPAIPFTSE